MNYTIIKYEKDNISLDVRFDEENKTIWLTQSEIAVVFNLTKNNIARRLNTLIKELYSDLDSPLNVRKELVNNRLTKLYNLKLIIELYYDIKSSSAHNFILWAEKYINKKIKFPIINFSLREAIESKIYNIKDEKVMLDYELADIYGYDMYTFDELIKNNIDQFPENYRFQLTQEEFNSILKSQNIIPNCNENRELPYVFTMQGVCILTTFFHGLVALERNTIILRIFADEIKKRVEEQRKEIKALHKELSKFKEKISKIKENY